MKNNSHLGLATRALHVGNEPDPSTGAIIPPLFQTSTYVQAGPGEHKGFEYTRTHNPTRRRLEACLASLENAEYCVTTSSGMAATMLMMQAFPAKSSVLCGDDVYGGTFRLFTTVCHDRHNFNFVDTTDLNKVEKALKQFKPMLIWAETPTNPLLKITDIKGLCDLAKKYGALVAVDNTFMSPYFQNPLTLGADFVVHSLTKYINGHSDVVGGAIMLNDKKLHEGLYKLQNSIGPCASPFDSWLVLRGVKTLAVRMEAHQKNAMQIATWLEKNPQVERVVYQGLKSHPQHAIAQEQMSGFGGMITFFIKGGMKESLHFLKSVTLFSLAESLGGVESLIEHPAIMTHASIPLENRLSIGITDNLIRISVGIEDGNDLLQDLDLAFKNTY